MVNKVILVLKENFCNDIVWIEGCDLLRNISKISYLIADVGESFRA